MMRGQIAGRRVLIKIAAKEANTLAPWIRPRTPPLIGVAGHQGAGATGSELTRRSARVRDCGDMGRPFFGFVNSPVSSARRPKPRV